MSNSHRRPDASGLLYNRVHIYGTYSGCGHSALMRLSSLSAIAMWSYSLEASNGRTRDVLIAEHVETFNSRALVRLTTTEMIYQKNLHGSTSILLVLVDSHTIAFTRSPMLQADGQLDTFGALTTISSPIASHSPLSSAPPYRHGPASRVDKVYFRLEQLFQQATAERHQLR